MNTPGGSTPFVAPGDVLAGKYRVERVLGQGGMGVVVAAHHLQLDTKVAIKLLLPEMLEHPESLSRFEREARAAVRISSEHVARVLDVGALPSGTPFIVMEFLEGTDLHALVRSQGPLPIEQAVEFVLMACIAVAEAHGLGIVHRDLKPANLFCVRRPDGQLSVKVLDFGISKQVDGIGASLSVTKTTAVMGSPLYMSPEQMRSAKSADARSDIWALGVILYELLSGHVPFLGETATEVAVKVSMEPPPSLRGHRPEVPEGLEAVVLKCLEKEGRRRYDNVAELAVALSPFAPERARSSIERITGTIQAAGLSDRPPKMPDAALASSVVRTGGSVPAVGNTTAAIARGRRSAIVASLALTVLVGAIGVGVLVVKVAHRRRLTAAGTAEQPRPPAPLASLTTSGSTEPIVADLTPAATAAADAGTAPGASSSRPHWAPQPPPVAPGPAPSKSAHPPSSAPGSGCDPPYWFDQLGGKHYKKECYP
jgi:serine/threonine-protein kinase